jgi:hypothetical protein
MSKLSRDYDISKSALEQKYRFFVNSIVTKLTIEFKLLV